MLKREIGECRMRSCEGLEKLFLKGRGVIVKSWG